MTRDFVLRGIRFGNGGSRPRTVDELLSFRDIVQADNRHTPPGQSTLLNRQTGESAEFAELIPEYLRAGYAELMKGNGCTAIEQWEALYARYPSAEVCGHLARAHYYQTYFLGHPLGHPQHSEHIREMRIWAERALMLNPNSAIGHAMLAGAIGREAVLTGSQKQIILSAWKVRHHAERALLIDNHWVAHFVLGSWHREIAAVSAWLKTLARLFFVQVPTGSYQQSLFHFQEILKQYPANNTIYAEMGYTYERMGDLKKAVEMFEICVSRPLFKHPLAPYLTEAASRKLVGRR